MGRLVSAKRAVAGRPILQMLMGQLQGDCPYVLFAWLARSTSLRVGQYFAAMVEWWAQPTLRNSMECLAASLRRGNEGEVEAGDLGLGGAAQNQWVTRGYVLVNRPRECGRDSREASGWA
jgi:hypothetical protein